MNLFSALASYSYLVPSWAAFGALVWHTRILQPFLVFSQPSVLSTDNPPRFVRLLGVLVLVQDLTLGMPGMVGA